MDELLACICEQINEQLRRDGVMYPTAVIISNNGKNVEIVESSPLRSESDELMLADRIRMFASDLKAETVCLAVPSLSAQYKEVKGVPRMLVIVESFEHGVWYGVTPINKRVRKLNLTKGVLDNVKLSGFLPTSKTLH